MTVAHRVDAPGVAGPLRALGTIRYSAVTKSPSAQLWIFRLTLVLVTYYMNTINSKRTTVCTFSKCPLYH